jgi:hypothetical protein
MGPESRSVNRKNGLLDLTSEHQGIAMPTVLTCVLPAPLLRLALPFLPSPGATLPPSLVSCRCFTHSPFHPVRGAHLVFLFFYSAAASEVSSILEQRISGSSAGADVQETGRVLSELHCSVFLQPHLLTLPLALSHW